MLNISYLYIFFLFLTICYLIYFFYNSRHDSNELNNKILLKNLLERLDMDLPEELKALENSSTDSHEL